VHVIKGAKKKTALILPVGYLNIVLYPFWVPRKLLGLFAIFSVFPKFLISIKEGKIWTILQRLQDDLARRTFRCPCTSNGTFLLPIENLVNLVTLFVWLDHHYVRH